jgi:DNA-binding LytR/AlgR family response regulator
VDYLLKPVREERLHQAVERARRRAGDDRLHIDFKRRVLEADPAGESGSAGKIVGRSGQSYVLLPLEKVIAAQAEGELVWILTEGKRYLATMTLGALEERLASQGFSRVHRSTLVNLSHISKIGRLSSQRWMLTLTNELEVTVSKRKASSIREILRL